MNNRPFYITMALWLTSFALLIPSLEAQDAFAQKFLAKSQSLAKDKDFLKVQQSFNWNFNNQTQLDSKDFIKQSIFKDWL